MIGLGEIEEPGAIVASRDYRVVHSFDGGASAFVGHARVGIAVVHQSGVELGRQVGVEVDHGGRIGGCVVVARCH